VRDSRLLGTGVGHSDILATSAVSKDAVDHPTVSCHSTRFRTTRPESRDFRRGGAVHSSCKHWWPSTPATLPVSSAPLSSLFPLGQFSPSTQSHTIGLSVYQHIELIYCVCFHLSIITPAYSDLATQARSLRLCASIGSNSTWYLLLGPLTSVSLMPSQTRRTKDCPSLGGSVMVQSDEQPFVGKRRQSKPDTMIAQSQSVRPKLHVVVWCRSHTDNNYPVERDDQASTWPE